jgi:ribosomal protein L5
MNVQIIKGIKEKLYCTKKELNKFPLRVILSYKLKSQSSNKLIFLSNLILIEKIVGQKMEFIRGKKQIQNFNIKKNSIFGAYVTLTGLNAFKFLTMLSASIPKLGEYSRLDMRHVIKSQNISFGLNKILFLESISVLADWEDFSYIYQNAKYGIDFHCEFLNKYMNHIFLSMCHINNYY